MAHIKFIGILIIMVTFVHCNLSAQKKFELSDVSKLINLTDPQISPDGKSIVIVVSRPDYFLNRFNSELVIIETATGKQRVLTQDRSNVSHPRWSQNGQWLAFLSKADKTKESTLQIFLLSMFGGEAKQLTKAAKGVQHFSWNPNSESLAYVTADDPKNKSEIEKGYSGFEVQNNDMFISSQPVSSHIWLVNIASGIQKRLTSGDWSLPVTIPPGPPSSPLSWSPDGKSILFVRVPDPYSGDGRLKSLQMLNVEDGSIKAITSRNSLESYPNFSPDGNNISYWYKKSGLSEEINEIWTTTKNGGEGKNISTDIDRDVYRPIWMPDSRSMLIGGHDDNKTSLWLLSLDGNAKKLNLGNVAPSWGFWIDAAVGNNGSIAFIGSQPTQPSELYYMTSPNAKPLPLTNFNKEVSSLSMGKTETLRWENEGFNHAGVLTFPVNYIPGNKYPLVLVIHGGPSSASVEQFSRFAQILANQGYFIFEPNYRGSDNLGSKYKIAIVHDAGSGPGRDVMAGLIKLKNLGMIDTGHIGISGWSYGGFMTVWLTGHYPGWKAAVAGAAVTDWVDQYNLGDANVGRATALGGSPWIGNNMHDYIEQSPITASVNIKAPTLILANTADPRVPISQSYKLYHALKDNGTITKFIAWPIPAHNASDPITQMERDREWISWLNKYLK